MSRAESFRAILMYRYSGGEYQRCQSHYPYVNPTGKNLLRNFAIKIPQWKLYSYLAIIPASVSAAIPAVVSSAITPWAAARRAWALWRARSLWWTWTAGWARTLRRARRAAPRAALLILNQFVICERFFLEKLVEVIWHNMCSFRFYSIVYAEEGRRCGEKLMIFGPIQSVRTKIVNVRPAFYKV